MHLGVNYAIITEVTQWTTNTTEALFTRFGNLAYMAGQNIIIDYMDLLVIIYE